MAGATSLQSHNGAWHAAPVTVIRQTLQGMLDSCDATLVHRCRAIVGLHPDEATESLVDAALAHRRPFAVVPCCVLPALFPERRAPRSRVAVRKYGAFVEYLRHKDHRIQTARLPFAGRSLLLYMRASDYEQPLQPPPRPNYTPCALAAKAGDLTRLCELRAAGLPWNEETAQAAAWAGHLSVLKYAHDHGCPWSWPVVCQAAQLGGRVEIVRWAQAHMTGSSGAAADPDGLCCLTTMN